MRKLLRLLFRLFLLSFVILIGVLAIKTISFSSKQIAVEAIDEMPISDDVITRLAGAIQIPTVSNEAATDTLVFSKMVDYIQTNYPLVDSLLNKELINDFSLLYKWPGRNANLKPILLMGHTDVVPVEESSLSEWTVPPFSGAVKDGYVWGRGTLDDKLTVFSILEAVSLLLKEDYQPERTVYLSFGHDEEVGGKYGAQTLARRFKKQGVQFEYTIDEGMIILEEALSGLDQPACIIGVAEKGYTTLTLSINLENGGHSSMPPSETAIGALSKAIAKLEANPFPAKLDGATKGLLMHVGPEMNLINKVIFANLWLFGGLLTDELSKSPSSNAIIRTTTAPTMLRSGIRENVLPTKASAKINFRIIPGETAVTVADYVRKVIDDERIVVIPGGKQVSSDPSPVSDTKAFGFSVIQRTAQEIFPEVVVTPGLVIAATDSRFFSEVSDQTYRFMPVKLTKADLSRIHGINERIHTDNYKKGIHFYYQLIKNSCK